MKIAPVIISLTLALSAATSCKETKAPAPTGVGGNGGFGGAYTITAGAAGNAGSAGSAGCQCNVPLEDE